jgi:hypothetical protein
MTAPFPGVPISTENDFDTNLAAAAASGEVRIKIRRFVGNGFSDGEVSIPVD